MKEYGRIYFGLRKVELRQRIKQHDNMIKGMKKLEEDAHDSRDDSAGIRMREENNETEEGEEPK
jgi:hypothetical protein